jgi:Holliday junction resolvase RusA-like endonuclease
MIKILIPGRPVPYVRTTQKAKHLQKSYLRYASYKGFVQTHVKNQYKGPVLEEPIYISINVFLKGKTTPMGNDGDIDNYIKGILDSLNKVAFKDDRQVVNISATKSSDEYERVEIIMFESTNYDDRIKYNSLLVKKLFKEQEQLFIKREELRMIADGQLTLEDI